LPSRFLLSRLCASHHKKQSPAAATVVVVVTLVCLVVSQTTSQKATIFASGSQCGQAHETKASHEKEPASKKETRAVAIVQIH
jgi:ABC-type molybdate transport system substrate-binding protein